VKTLGVQYSNIIRKINNQKLFENFFIVPNLHKVERNFNVNFWGQWHKNLFWIFGAFFLETSSIACAVLQFFKKTFMGNFLNDNY
jgi:hypothetical protein